jgi:hypothetical protein
MAERTYILIYAVGLGFRNETYVDYAKTFTARNPSGEDPGNFVAVQDFMRIMQERLEYTQGNAVINLVGVDLDSLHDVFTETGHADSAKFIKELMSLPPDELEDAIICIMTEDNPPTRMEEESLLMQLEVNAEPFPKEL